jgi:hypothetical protein
MWKRGIIEITYIEYGFKLMNFTSFGDLYTAEGLFRKIASGPLSYSLNQV